MSLVAKNIFEKKLPSERELPTLARDLFKHLEKNSILLVSGALGAGKTTTVKAFGEICGLQMIQSPTYSVHQRYQNENITIDHFDLYRMQDEDDLVSTGFWDLIQDKKSLVIIEWFEKIKGSDWLRPEAPLRKIFGLKISVEQSGERILNFTNCLRTPFLQLILPVEICPEPTRLLF